MSRIVDIRNPLCLTYVWNSWDSKPLMSHLWVFFFIFNKVYIHCLCIFIYVMEIKMVWNMDENVPDNMILYIFTNSNILHFYCGLFHNLLEFPNCSCPSQALIPTYNTTNSCSEQIKDFGGCYFLFLAS